MLFQGFYSFLSLCFLIIMRRASFVCHALPSLGGCSFSSQAWKQQHSTVTSETMSQTLYSLNWFSQAFCHRDRKQPPQRVSRLSPYNIEMGAGGGVGRFWLETNSVSMALGRWFNYSVSQLHACKMRVVIRVLSLVWELNEMGFKNLVQCLVHGRCSKKITSCSKFYFW